LPNRTIQRTGHTEIAAQRLADTGEKEPDDVALIGMGVLDCLDGAAAQAGVELPFIGAKTGCTSNQGCRNQPSSNDGDDNQQQSAQY